MNAWTDSDRAHMQYALGLAALGMNSTDPNPRVGCVLVQDGRIVGEGWHERAGEAHAEVRALQVAGAAARGATAYITLEPCAAQGRTPPCTRALLEAGVAGVIYAIADPDPRMRNGAQHLREGGIEVRGGLCEDEARALNPGFFKRHEQHLPWVRVKVGASLDGRTALANGASRWITTQAARKDAQRYRARSSVVLTGVGTVLADDPAMNVRLEGIIRQPLRVVLDSRLRSPRESRIFDRDGDSLVIGVESDDTRRSSLERAGARVELLPADPDGRVSLRAALEHLAAESANEIWVEAGATLTGALLAAGLVDELIVYLAPCLLGHEARAMAELPTVPSLDDRLALRFTDQRLIDGDLRLTARVLPRSGS
jgi:diaminohydroxyphosphoribosylaminopyrimidine deaminase / 5-amino-6-(5-phosphoribosylamino)uracil reductase